MDERPTDTGPDNGLTRRRGRRVVTALAVAGVLAVIPAGAVPAQNTPDNGQRGNGDRDRGDCPEKDGRQSQGSAQI